MKRVFLRFSNKVSKQSISFQRIEAILETKSEFLMSFHFQILIFWPIPIRKLMFCVSLKPHVQLVQSKTELYVLKILINVYQYHEIL